MARACLYHAATSSRVYTTVRIHEREIAKLHSGMLVSEACSPFNCSTRQSSISSFNRESRFLYDFRPHSSFALLLNILLIGLFLNALLHICCFRSATSRTKETKTIAMESDTQSHGCRRSLSCLSPFPLPLAIRAIVSCLRQMDLKQDIKERHGLIHFALE